MKLVSTLVLLIAFAVCHSQTVYTNKNDISEAKEIIFFGYDFGHFKLFEPKRLYEEGIKTHIPNWIEYLNAKEDEDFLKKKMRKSKIIYDFKYITDVYKSLSDSGLVSMNKHSIPPDSIQEIVNRYQTLHKEGIGLTIIVECFDKKNEEASAYFTFFDIATRKVLISNHYATNNHAWGIGLSTFWGRALDATVYAYFDGVYKKDLKKK